MLGGQAAGPLGCLLTHAWLLQPAITPRHQHDPSDPSTTTLLLPHQEAIPTITNKPSKPEVLVGEAFTYQIVIGNNGTASLTSMSLSASLPAGVKATAVKDAACRVSAGGANMTCNFGTTSLAPQATRTVVLTASALVPGTFTAPASLTGQVSPARMKTVSAPALLTAQVGLSG